MNEYSKDEIVKFFTSVVNPVLKDFEAELKKNGWRTDLQIRNPEESSHWFDNTFSASINASQDGEVRLFYYHIGANPTPASSNRYHVLCMRTNGQPGQFPSGGRFEGQYHRNINTTTRVQFLKDVKEGRFY